jgi:plastocyanin
LVRARAERAAALNLKKSTLESGISSREGESSVGGRARAKFTKGRVVLKIHVLIRFVASPQAYPGFDSCKPHVLCVLRLTALFAALAFTPCQAEDANNAGVGPATTVSMDHNTFIPSEITVVPGTTVTWVNKETMPHTVVDMNKRFRSKTLAKDAGFSFTFATEGDYDYQCSIHPNMKGKVIVKPVS